MSRPSPTQEHVARRFDRRSFLRGRFFGEPAAESPSAPPARTVSVSEVHCLAHRGVGCSTCRERCPVPGAIKVEAGRPTIDPARCDGCGQCIAACPAPVLALRMVTIKPIDAGSI